jgi:CheY-like chemotaxis protein
MHTSIRAARAVAVLLIASGAAGAASTLLPSLDERWIYVVAVALIGAMEGFVIGLISVLVAVVAYEFMIHSSMSFTPERDLLLLGAGVASALGARAARVTAARPRIRVSQQRLLPPPTLVDEQERFTTALQIDALERKVAREQARADEAERALAEAREANENTRGAALEHALEASRSTSESLAVRVAELEQTIDMLDQQIETLEHERDEWSEKLQTIVAHLASDHEADLGQALLEKEEARAEVRSLTARIAELKRMLEERGGDDRRHSVLLVHHDAMLRSMAKNALERNGYRVTAAGDSLEALRIAITEKPDVILADLTLAQLLKSRGETSSTKVILIGPADPDFSADDFLGDPSNLEEMRATIEAVLQRGPQSPRQ